LPPAKSKNLDCVSLSTAEAIAVPGNKGSPVRGQGRKQGSVVGIIAKPLPGSIRQSRAMLPRVAGFAGIEEYGEPS
jgi:hypothetical protein